MELLVLLLGLTVVTVVGHGIWVVLALIARTLADESSPPTKRLGGCVGCGRPLKPEQEQCAHCGKLQPGVKTVALADLEAVERQLQRWRDRGELKPRRAQQYLLRVEAYRRKLRQPAIAARDAKTLAPSVKARQPAPQRPPSALPVEFPLPAGAVKPPATEPFAVLRREAPAATAVLSHSPAAEIAPTPQSPPLEKPATAPPQQAPLPSPPPRVPPAPRPLPEPRRTLAEMLTAFMEQRNIRWGELVGGMLIVCSSIALVISLWDALNAIPYFQFFIFVGATGAVFGVGLYTEHRWKLESTSRGILIIATLLVPLNFVAMAATARAGWDAFALLAELVSLGFFVALVERSARVLTPRWRWPLALAVAGNSGLLLLARHRLSPGWLAAAGAAAVACHGLALGAALVSLRREMLASLPADGTSPHGRHRFGAERASELFTLAGASSFALVAALGLFVARSGELAEVLNWFAPLAALAALPVCAAGIAIIRGLKEDQDLAGFRTAGTAVALAGGLGMIAAQALAWPAPAAMLAVGLFDFAALTALGLRCRLPIAHAAALVGLAVAYVTGAHLACGHFAAVEREQLGRRMLQLALAPQTGALLTVLFVVLAAICAAFVRRGKASEALIYARGCIVTAAISLGIVLCRGPIGGSGGWLVLGTCSVYALGSLLFNLRGRQPRLTYLASALLGVGLVDAGFLRPVVVAACPWLAVCLAHATITTALAVACRRCGGLAASEAERAFVQPLLRMASISSTAALAALPWIGAQPAAALALHLTWLAGIWLALAMLQRSVSWFAAFQAALTASVLAAVTAWLHKQPWAPSEAFLLVAPRSLQTYGIGLALLCAGWSTARIVLRRVPGAAVWLDDGAAWFDRWTFYGLSAASLALAAWNVLPDLINELSPTGAPLLAPSGAGTFAFGPLAWQLVAFQAVGLLLSLWHRWRWRETACGVLLLVTAALLVAGPFAGSLAAASALRWNLSGAFLLGSALVWLRAPLARAAQALRCRCEIGERGPALTRGLLTALCVLPVFVITGVVVALRLSGLPPAGPLPGSALAAVGTTLSHLIPLAIIALVLLGHALRETSAGYAFSAGLATNVTLGGGYALSVRQFGVAEGVTLLQLCTVVAAIWCIGWLACRRKILAISGREESSSAHPLLGVQLGQARLGNVLLVLPAVGMLTLFSPDAFDEARSWIAAVGSPLGWLALAATLGAGHLARWQRRQRLRPEIVGLVGMAALGLGACTIAWAGGGDLWAYRALMLGWALYAVSVVAAAWRVTSFHASARSGATLDAVVRSAALWVRIAGLLALALGVKTAVFHPGEQLWAAASIALAGAACAAMAVWRRREPWAFVAGLAVNLAASIVVWHGNFAERFYFADAWLPLVQANVIAGSAVALVWLAAHARMYSDRLLSTDAAPFLCLQVALVALGGLMAVGIPLGELVLQPGQTPASLLQAGSRGGALAWLLSGAAVALYCRKIARRELPYVLATLLLGAGVLGAGAAAAWRNEPWLAYHVVTAAWAASGFLLLAVAMVVAPKVDWLKSLARGETAIAWISTIEALLATLALRGAWEDPMPFSCVAATLSASLLAALASVALGKPDHKYASGALVHLAIVFAGVATEGRAMVEWWLAHLIALGAQAVVWSLVERWVEGEPSAERQGEMPPFRYAAASLAVGLLCVTVAYNTAVAAGWSPTPVPWLTPFAFRHSPAALEAGRVGWLAWAAWGAAAAAVVVMLREVRARYCGQGLYAIGTAGVLLAVQRTTASPLGLAQGLAWAAAAYLLAAALSPALTGKLKLPQIALPPTLRGEAPWLSPTQLVLSMFVAGLSLWLTLAPSLAMDRMPGCLAAALLWGVAWAHARRPEEACSASWRSVALALAVLVAAEFGWTWLAGEGANWLLRQIILAAALFLGIVVAQFALPKWAPGCGEWIESARRAAVAWGGLLLPLLAAVLAQERALHVPEHGVAMAMPAKLAMAGMLAGAAGLALCYAIFPQRDPLRLSLRGRTAYVYAAELFGLLVVVHFRTTMPKLIPLGLVERYWTLIVLLVAFAGAALSELFERRKLNVLAEPLARTALLAPLVPALGHWLRPAASVDVVAVLFLAAVFYGLQAALKRSWGLACLAIVAGNAALWIVWHRLHVDFFHHPQLWLIPVALVVLVAEYVERARLAAQQAAAVRYVALSAIYVSSTVDVVMSHVGRDLSLPLVLVLMGLSVTGVLAGIMLRVRSFLYLGATFLLVDLSLMIYHAAWDRGHAWVFWLTGIALGAAIIALFAVFEKRRNELAPALERFKQWN